MDLSQFYTNMLTAHENRLKSLNARWRRDAITLPELRAAFYIEQRAWQDFVWEMQHHYECGQVVTYDKLTDAQKQEYDIYPNMPLCGLLKYREQILPMYDDDPGQQVVAALRGEMISGGAYNLEYCEEFMSRVDYLLDHDITFQY